MSLAFRLVGIVWMASCAALWLYIGFFVPTPDFGDGWWNWSVPRMLADTRFGLTFVPILLAIPGAWLWDLGRKQDRRSE